MQILSGEENKLICIFYIWSEFFSHQEQREKQANKQNKTKQNTFFFFSLGYQWSNMQLSVWYLKETGLKHISWKYSSIVWFIFKEIPTCQQKKKKTQRFYTMILNTFLF